MQPLDTISVNLCWTQDGCIAPAGWYFMLMDLSVKIHSPQSPSKSFGCHQWAFYKILTEFFLLVICHSAYLSILIGEIIWLIAEVEDQFAKMVVSQLSCYFDFDSSEDGLISQWGVMFGKQNLNIVLWNVLCLFMETVAFQFMDFWGYSETKINAVNPKRIFLVDFWWLK